MDNKDKLTANLNFTVPVFLNEGLDKASDDMEHTKSDILRSLLYEFLKTCGYVSPVKELEEDLVAS